MNPADVLLSGEYPSLSPLPIGEDEVIGGVPPALTTPGPAPVTMGAQVVPPSAHPSLTDTSPEAVAQILIAVNRSLGIDLGDLDYAQFIVPEDQEEDDSPRSREGKREYTHIQLVCEACGHIIVAVGRAVYLAIQEAGDDIEARLAIPKRKRGGILGFKELAAKAKLSPWHFHRVFRSITDVTPKAYGEACWDYLLITNGFDVEAKSPQAAVESAVVPQVSAPAPGRGPGRIAKSASRSRSRSRPRHASQTQQQVLTALSGSDGVVKQHRSRSAARSSSFSSRYLPDFAAEAVAAAQAQPLQQPSNLAHHPPPTGVPTPSAVASAPVPLPGHSAMPPGPSLAGTPGGIVPRSRRNSTPQPLPFLPPGTVAGSIGEFMYADPPNMYENLSYPDHIFTDPIMPTPALDSTIESTPSTGYDGNVDVDINRPSDMPDLNALSLDKELDWKHEDPSLAPLIGDPELSSQFFIDKDYDAGHPRELTPDFNNIKLMDPLEEPSLFRTEF